MRFQISYKGDKKYATYNVISKKRRSLVFQRNFLRAFKSLFEASSIFVIFTFI